MNIDRRALVTAALVFASAARASAEPDTTTDTPLSSPTEEQADSVVKADNRASLTLGGTFNTSCDFMKIPDCQSWRFFADLRTKGDDHGYTVISGGMYTERGKGSLQPPLPISTLNALIGTAYEKVNGKADGTIGSISYSKYMFGQKGPILGAAEVNVSLGLVTGQGCLNGEAGYELYVPVTIAGGINVPQKKTLRHSICREKDAPWGSLVLAQAFETAIGPHSRLTLNPFVQASIARVAAGMGLGIAIDTAGASRPNPDRFLGKPLPETKGLTASVGIYPTLTFFDYASYLAQSKADSLAEKTEDALSLWIQTPITGKDLLNAAQFESSNGVDFLVHGMVSGPISESLRIAATMDTKAYPKSKGNNTQFGLSLTGTFR